MKKLLLAVMIIACGFSEIVNGGMICQSPAYSKFTGQVSQCECPDNLVKKVIDGAQYGFPGKVLVGCQTKEESGLQKEIERWEAKFKSSYSFDFGNFASFVQSFSRFGPKNTSPEFRYIKEFFCTASISDNGKRQFKNNLGDPKWIDDRNGEPSKGNYKELCPAEYLHQMENVKK